MSSTNASVHSVNPAQARFDDLRLCQSLKTALGLRFNLRADSFHFQSDGQPRSEEISTDALIALISKTLAQQPDLFPLAQLRPRRLRRIMIVLRALCADAGDEALLPLQHFVEARLALQPGADVTSAQVRVAFELECQRLGEIVLSRYEFHRRLPGLIKQRFGIAKSHQILRPADGRLTMRKGWRGLLLKDATDATDGEDAEAGILPKIQNR